MPACKHRSSCNVLKAACRVESPSDTRKVACEILPEIAKLRLQARQISPAAISGPCSWRMCTFGSGHKSTSNSGCGVLSAMLRNASSSRRSTSGRGLATAPDGSMAPDRPPSSGCAWQGLQLWPLCACWPNAVGHVPTLADGGSLQSVSSSRDKTSELTSCHAGRMRDRSF